MDSAARCDWGSGVGPRSSGTSLGVSLVLLRPAEFGDGGGVAVEDVRPHAAPGRRPVHFEQLAFGGVSHLQVAPAQQNHQVLREQQEELKCRFRFFCLASLRDWLVRVRLDMYASHVSPTRLLSKK